MAPELGTPGRSDGHPTSEAEDTGTPLSTLLFFGAILFLVFDRGLRAKLGTYAGLVLDPTIGFHGHDPALTLLLAATITGVGTGLVRTALVDWVSLSKTKATVQAWQAAFKEAHETDDRDRVDALKTLQPEVMKLQSRASKQQMTAMLPSMLIVIPVIGWLWQFLQHLETPAMVAPWGTTSLLTGAPVVGFLPTWVLIYSLFSFPISQIVTKGLKAAQARTKLGSRPVRR